MGTLTRTSLILGLVAVIGIFVYGGLVGGWPFFERMSWVVIIIGLPIAVYQLLLLQFEQRRIADELLRRPLLATGFNVTSDGKDVAQDMRVAPTWPDGSQVSAPVTIHWLTLNRGSRTAKEVLINIHLPDKLAAVMPSKLVVRDPQTHEALLVYSEKFDLHPQDIHMVNCDFVFPAGEQVFEIPVTASMLDTAQVSETLTIRVQGAPLMQGLPTPDTSFQASGNNPAS